MSEYQFMPEALNDLFELWSYIAADNVDAASRVEKAVYAPTKTSPFLQEAKNAKIAPKWFDFVVIFVFY
jgi:hypothetical protein